VWKIDRNAKPLSASDADALGAAGFCEGRQKTNKVIKAPAMHTQSVSARIWGSSAMDTAQTREDRAIGAEQPLSEVDEGKRRDRSQSAAISAGNWKARVEPGGKEKSKTTDMDSAMNSAAVSVWERPGILIVQRIN
jgi:hypothetical protein